MKTLFPVIAGAAAATIMVALIAAPSSAFADTASVVNNVSVSADSGGNSVGSGGTVINGTSTASVHIEQTVNGVTEPSIDITTSTQGSAHVHVDQRVSANNDAVTSTHQIEISSSASRASSSALATVTTTTNAAFATVASTTITIVNAVGSFFTNIFHWFSSHIG